MRKMATHKLHKQKGPSKPRWCLACPVLPAVLSVAVLLAWALVTRVPVAAAAGGSTPTSACTGEVAGVSVSGGNQQVAKVGTAFAQSLEVLVVDTAGCGVPGAEVTFVAPSSGAGGYFPGEVTTVTVATSSSGTATAPTFTANNVSGTFTVVAEASGYDADFSLTNTTVGVAASLNVVSGNAQGAKVGATFPSPLVVSVTDSSGGPVSGATVSFAVQAGSTGASATFTGGGLSATEQTNEAGQATSPELVAGTTAGSFSVVASVAGLSSVATFQLTVGSGSPATLVAGAGSSQSTELGTDFPVPLAVTVTDADGNDVAGALVTFEAPASGASGTFAGAGRAVSVSTNSDGVATAPDFSANETVGGYVVTATVRGAASPVAFALVNEPRTGASAPGPEGSYRLVTSSGRVLSSGGAANLGSPSAQQLRGSKVVAMASAPGGKGYWLATARGAVYAYGDARSYGSPAGLHLAKPIVGMAATPDGKGYWLVASDGGIFSYGDARFYGSTGKLHLVAPIVGIAAAPGGDGYWLAGRDGGVFAFGKATYYGSGLGLSPKPVVALVPSPDGYGYWVVSSNGTAAGFGDAGAQGSPTLRAGTVVAGAAA